jgi:hypothetical protein
MRAFFTIYVARKIELGKYLFIKAENGIFEDQISRKVMIK